MTPLAVAKLKLALSKLLFAEIERADLTIGALAKASGLSDQTARDIVSGASDPSLSRVLALEKALGRPPGWIARQLSRLD